MSKSFKNPQLSNIGMLDLDIQTMITNQTYTLTLGCNPPLLHIAS